MWFVISSYHNVWKSNYSWKNSRVMALRWKANSWVLAPKNQRINKLITKQTNYYKSGFSIPIHQCYSEHCHPNLKKINDIDESVLFPFCVFYGAWCKFVYGGTRCLSLAVMESSAQIRSVGCQRRSDKNSNFILCTSFKFHPTSENLMIFFFFLNTSIQRWRIPMITLVLADKTELIVLEIIRHKSP